MKDYRVTVIASDRRERSNLVLKIRLLCHCAPRNDTASRGAVMPLVLTSLLAIGMMAGAFVHLGVYEERSSVRSFDAQQAFYLSEAAVDRAYQWLRAQPSPPGGPGVISSTDILGADLVALGPNGSYRVTIDPDDDNVTSYLKRYTIVGEGSAGPQATPTVVRQTSLVVQTESFARYAYFTDNERSPSGSIVWFITNDHIEGPTHTNGRFSMRGIPVFDGPVSSVNSTINYYNPPPPEGNNPEFNGGLQLGVPAKTFLQTLPSNLETAATTGGVLLTGNATVTLLSDGTMQVVQATTTTQALPGNGVLFVKDGNLNLSGSLNGQLTIATNKTVTITSNVTYAADPQTDPDSDDILGIVAQENILIDDAAPTNVTVQAAMMAMETSFKVENYASIPAKGTLTVYGGIVQEKRGPVGTFNPATGTKTSGYTKSYHYDERLLSMIPPFFPVTGDYVSLLWRGEE